MKFMGMPIVVTLTAPQLPKDAALEVVLKAMMERYLKAEQAAPGAARLPVHPADVERLWKLAARPGWGGGRRTP